MEDDIKIEPIKTLWQVFVVQNSNVVVFAFVEAYTYTEAVKTIAEDKQLSIQDLMKDDVTIYARTVGFTVDKSRLMTAEDVVEKGSLISITDIKSQVAAQTTKITEIEGKIASK